MYKFKCKLREEGNPSQTHSMEHYLSVAFAIANIHDSLSNYSTSSYTKTLVFSFMKTNKLL